MNNVVFNLTQSVDHHKNILRAVTCNSKGLVVTGSFDKTCAIFSSDSSGLYSLLRSTDYHTDYVYVVKSDVKDRGFFSGGKDAKIMLMDNEGNPLAEFLGHTMAVNSISQTPYDSDWIVSGSWDGTAKIWDLNTRQCLFSLNDHSFAVSTLALPGQRTITGSQDKALRFWDKDKSIRVINNAHEEIIRSILLSPDNHSFYTSSNDNTIKHWTMTGELIDTYIGHEGFVYNLCCDPKDPERVFSCSDDRVVKMWKDGETMQSIIHPNTVWDIVLNPINEDLITACADGVLRTFSRDSQRWLPEKDLEDYTNMCVLSNMSNEQGNENIDPTKYPSIEEMQTMIGKEGEIRIFNNKGNAEAYVFKQSEMKWNLMGEVLGAKDTKKHYPGDKHFPAGDYDFIFDVDLEGKTSKLPFNKGGNALIAAEKFIGREELHKLYVDDIAKFLRQNAGKQPKPASTAPKVTMTSAKPQAKPKKVIPSSSSSLIFPSAIFAVHDAVNVEGPLKKMLEYNASLISENQVDKALKEQQVAMLKGFLAVIGKTGFYHNSTFNEPDVGNFLDLMLKWNGDYLIPVFDVYRMFLLHPRTNDFFKRPGNGMQELTIVLDGIKNGSVTLIILGIRILNNHFLNEGSRVFISSKRQEVLDTVSVHLDSDNRHVRSAIVTLLFNYSIIFSTKEDSEAALQILSLINELLGTEKDSGNLTRLLLSLGNLFCQIESNRTIGNDMEIASAVSAVVVPTDDEEAGKTIEELKGYLLGIFK